MRTAATTLLVGFACVTPEGLYAQGLSCENAADAGDILVTQFGGTLYRVDPDLTDPPGPVISSGYNSIAYDADGRLIANRAAEVLEVDLQACTETVLSDSSKGSLADAPDMIVVGDFLYATDDSGGIRGVIRVDLRDGTQRLVASSAPIVFPNPITAKFRSPAGITAGDDGYLYVVDQGSPIGGTDGRIVRVDPSVPYDAEDPEANQVVIATGFNSSLEPGEGFEGHKYVELQDPLGITIDPGTGDFLVTDYGRILRFTSDGELKVDETINLSVPLTITHDIEIDGEGNYIVAGHDIYGTISAVLHVTPTGEVTNLTPEPRALNRPRRVAIVPASLPPVCGDVDESGAVTASDALAILLAAVGTTTCAACICDVEGSGTVTATDALVALKKSVGIAIELQCPPCQ